MNILKVIGRNKNFEYDKETMIKRLKLEESDKMIEKGKKKRSRSDLEAATDEQDRENTNDEPDTNQKLPTPEGSTFSDTGNKRPKQNNLDLSYTEATDVGSSQDDMENVILLLFLGALTLFMEEHLLLSVLAYTLVMLLLIFIPLFVSKKLYENED